MYSAHLDHFFGIQTEVEIPKYEERNIWKPIVLQTNWIMVSRDYEIRES